MNRSVSAANIVPLTFQGSAIMARHHVVVWFDHAQARVLFSDYYLKARDGMVGI
jgi:hypothetical protein